MAKTAHLILEIALGKAIERENKLKAENKRLRKVLRKIADQANRATMVQDRSVSIIKGVCGVIFSEAKQALKGK